MSEKIYGDRDLMAMDIAGNHYCRHVDHMTREKLHSKSDIAAELGWRDMQIAALQQKLDAVLAENVALKNYNLCCRPTEEEQKLLREGDYTPEELWGVGGVKSCPECSDAKTPATDTLLNAVRAEAIEQAAEKAPWLYGDQMGRSVEAIPKEQLIKWAARLRAETDTTPSQYESLAGGK
ncbi:hypothetical protein [Pantoea eucrina]|uniref:hypothetical protein n=1 Tax=Pantoea eucrina TaxID=472693 RepID=UPI000A2347D5|nr:hypothetical protein [Pantoea eucrina]ORM78310.1 hypothetical protein HA43_08170 [Pantoea eucrina]